MRAGESQEVTGAGLLGVEQMGAFGLVRWRRMPLSYACCTMTTLGSVSSEK